MNINQNFSIAFSYRGQPEIRINEGSVTFINGDLNINIQNLMEEALKINIELKKISSPFTLKTHKQCDQNKEFIINHLHYAYCTVSPKKFIENQEDRLTITTSTLAGAIIKELNYTLIKNTKFTPKVTTARRRSGSQIPAGSFVFIHVDPAQKNQNQPQGPTRSTVNHPRPRAEPYPTLSHSRPFEEFFLSTREIFPERQANLA